jgi:uncharacterized protein YqjF (DUF2071 family)
MSQMDCQGNLIPWHLCSIWLTERHALYTTFHRHLYRGDIHHAPWQLQLAELELSSNTMVNGQGMQLPA